MFNGIKSLFQKREFNVQQLRSFIYGPPTISGVAISEEMALGLTAVYRAVDLISSTIASLDGEVYKTVPGKGKVLQQNHAVSQILHDPNAFKFWRTLVQHTICSGNGYAEVERLVDDSPIGLHLVHWRNIRINQNPNGQIVYHLVREDRDIPARDMIHITTLSWDGVSGISPIRAARESLGIGVAAERWAGSVYGQGGVPRGFLKVKGIPNPETKANIRESWEIIHGGLNNANQVGILGGDTEWVETHMSPEDCQLLLSRTFQIEEVARIFGVPVNLLFSASQSSYNSNEESNIQFYQLGLRSLLENLEAEIDTKLLKRDERFRGYRVKFSIDQLIRGNFKACVDSWSRLVLTGIATQNEAREAIGLNPHEGGDALLVPTNVTATTEGNDGKETTNIGFNGLEQHQEQRSTPLALEDHSDYHEHLEQARAFVQQAFQQEVGRALRRQQKGKPTADEHRAYLCEALAPSLKAYGATSGKDLSVDDYASRWIEHTGQKDLAEVEVEELMELVEV
jgi:HK97 family phage portal protein